MAVSPGCLQVGQVAEGDHALQLGRVDLADRLGLDLEQALARIPGAASASNSSAFAVRVSTIEVEDATRAPPQRVHHRPGAAQVIEPRGVGGGTRNPAPEGDSSP